MSPLQPYLPRLVLDWQQTTPDALVKEIDGSMVFVDVSGFTKMSERLARQGKVGAEEVSDVIGTTFGTLLAEAYACGGSLIKFGGDALLVFFQGDGHALRAVAAAHGMRAELRRSGTFSTSSGKVTLRMSVGAHTGLFHFFLVGGSHRELIVAGPAATETVTMEGAASAGQVLLSPALAATLPAANRGRPLGPGVLLTGSPPAVERTEIHREAATFDLEPFVPVALRETVLAGEVEPEHRSVMIGFVHYGGFDDLVLTEGSGAAAAALDALVCSAQQAADAHGVAFLSSDIAPDGGKIILTAGAPVATGADEEQMLLAVREIVAGDSGLPLHIGVNKGPVFAGAIGPSYRQTYTVMGDDVNLAARLMAKANAGQIVATPGVLDASRTIFETTELEPFLVKGKKKPITAFTVGEAKGSRTTIAETGLPLLGRDVELAALMEAWESAQSGTGRVVELSAEPGMGKSRLLDEFLSRTDGARVIGAQCRLYQSATPYFPFRVLLRAAFGLEGLGHAEAVEALSVLVGKKAPSLRPWLSLIATAMDIEAEPSHEVQALDDKSRRVRLEQAVAALIAEVATAPVILVVEDTHWMDEPSRDLLARVTGSLRKSPWLVVLSRRPGEAGYVAADDGDALVRIDLAPLGSEPVIALIHAATQETPLRPQQEHELAERAAGNPLFLIELLDALLRGENVETMPTSVEGLIQARIDRLPTGDRRRLRALSVLGIGFRLEHATATLGLGKAEDVRTSLRDLGEFLSVDRRGWAEFRHALIRDAAYDGLPFRRRQELHATVGDSILGAAGDHPEEQAELLAVHYWHARRWDEAWRFSRIAGDHARDIYANLEAARFYERAVKATAHLDSVSREELADAWRHLGLVREIIGELDTALDAFRTAGAILVDPVAKAEVYMHRARVRFRAGAPASALRDAGVGLRLLEPYESDRANEIRAELLAWRAHVRLTQGKIRESIALASSAAEIAERVGARRVLATAYGVLDGGYAQLGEPDKAVYDVKALEIYRELGMLVSAGILEMNVGVKAYARGRWDEAVARYTRAQEELEHLGDHASAGFAGANLGEVLVSRGSLVEAEAVLHAARRSLRSAGVIFGAIFADLQLSRLHVARGETELAIEMFGAVIEEARSKGFADLVLEASIHLASAHLSAGRPGRALELLEEVAPDIVAEDAAWLQATFGRVKGTALLGMGRVDEAEDVLSAALNESRTQRLPYEEALSLAALSSIARQRGGSPNDEELQKAQRLLQLLGCPIEALVYP